MKSVNIQSNNSAFKSRDNNNTSIISTGDEPKMIESLFFSMFMDFCKQQFKSMTSQSSQINNKTPKLSRHMSSPPLSSIDINDFNTPHIRKTVSIIVKIFFE